MRAIPFAHRKPSITIAFYFMIAGQRTRAPTRPTFSWPDKYPRKSPHIACL